MAGERQGQTEHELETGTAEGWGGTAGVGEGQQSERGPRQRWR